MSSSGRSLISRLRFRRVAPTVPPRARQGDEVGRGSPHEAALIEASRAAGSAATVASEGLHSAVAAAEPQQVVAQSAAMTTAITAPSTLLAAGPVDDSQAAVVEIPDEDALPPGWDQWVNLPALPPEPPTGALVVRDDDRGARPMAPRPRRHAGLSLLRTAPRRVRSRSGSVATRRRPTSPAPRPSRRCGRTSMTTALRSTER
jgi:hypothetical protein